MGTPLGTADPNLNGRRFFRFGANDPGGPNNFNGLYCPPSYQCPPYVNASIEGILDTATDPNTPSNFGVAGPFIAAVSPVTCRFVYYPVANTIYLDAPSANFTFTGGSSVVGAGGGPIDNGMCRINGANSSRSIGQQYIELTLDIALHQPGTWYMYEIANNSQGNASYSNSPLDNNPNPPHKPLSDWSLWGYWTVTSPEP